MIIIEEDVEGRVGIRESGTRGGGRDEGDDRRAIRRV